jgi:hypothetical protein
VQQHCNAWPAAHATANVQRTADKLLLSIKFDATSQLELGHEYTFMWNYLMLLIILYVYKHYQQHKLDGVIFEYDYE